MAVNKKVRSISHRFEEMNPFIVLLKGLLSPEGQNWNFCDSNPVKSAALRHLYEKIGINPN